MNEQELKEYIDSLERELYEYRKLGTQRRIKAALYRDSRSRIRKRIAKSFLKWFVFAISMLWLLWIFLSWIEVVTHNCIPGYEYCVLNFFKVMF